MSKLTATGYDGDLYYREHADAGMDYLALGEWHHAYARMITAATLQSTYTHAAMLDGGCACGALVTAFKQTGVYRHVSGLDMSEHMVALGRATFELREDEIAVGNLAEIPLPNESVTLINTSQVLEHIPNYLVEHVLAEFWRVLVPGGRMFHNYAALRHGNPLDTHTGAGCDPTHVNVQPTRYWSESFYDAGFISDFESYDRFANSIERPPFSGCNFFEAYQGTWSCSAWIKP